jgi:hypothetical protein
MLKAGLHGLTGHIEFNEGKRSNFKLDFLKLKREELQKVGQWNPSTGINITDPTAFYETSATNITLVVMTREVSIVSHHCKISGSQGGAYEDGCLPSCCAV